VGWSASLPKPDRQPDRRELENHTGRSPQPNSWCATPGPPANRSAATQQPVCSTYGSNTATQSVPRSPSPASAETLPVAHGSAGHRHPPAIPTAPADTSVAHRWPTPPSPCSANNQSAAQFPRSRSPPTCAAVGSQPSPPRSTPASSLARLRPRSRENWSIFSCRTVVSIQLPSTLRGSKQPPR
jgi:hypothetical protein